MLTLHLLGDTILFGTTVFQCLLVLEIGLNISVFEKGGLSALTVGYQHRRTYLNSMTSTVD